MQYIKFFICLLLISSCGGGGGGGAQLFHLLNFAQFFSTDEDSTILDLLAAHANELVTFEYTLQTQLQMEH